MKKLVASAALLAAALVPFAALADDGKSSKSHSSDQFTLAVFGDWPYNHLLLDSARLLIDSVNADPEVKLVLHVGDIHSGSMPCTGAGQSPPPAGSVPSWNEGIYISVRAIQ